jgi:hypothetical protein
MRDAGVVVLAAAMRRHGIEILDQRSEISDLINEERYVHIENYGGNVFHRSPGAAGVVGIGDANATVPPAIADGLAQLVTVLAEHARDFSANDADTLQQSAEVISSELRSQAPDEARLKRATRLALSTGGAIVVGAMGSGLWEALAIWAGLNG